MNKFSRKSFSNVPSAVEEPVELENDFILRLPQEHAEKVHEWLKEGGAAFKEKLGIAFQNDIRHAQVRVEQDILHGKLVDMPCVVETMKTLDCKTFYKVADVSQMLVCREGAEEAEEEHKHKDQRSDKNKNPDNAGSPKKKDKQYQWPHGITPPLKNVRKRRFRKTLKKKYLDAPELEKELKRLLREDMQAVSVRWEVVTAEQEKQQKSKHHPKAQSQQHAAISSKPDTSSGSTLIRVDELFGGALSSSSEDSASDADSDFDNAGVSKNIRHQRPATSSIFEAQTSMTATSADDEEDEEGRQLAQQLMMNDETADEDSAAIDSETLRMRVVQLQSELVQLEKTRKAYERQISTLENPLLKERMQQDINELLSKEKDIRNEVDALKREIQKKP